MSSKSSGGENPSSADGQNLSLKGIEGYGYASTNSCINQLSCRMADISTDAGQEDEWEANAKKSKSQGGGNIAKQWDSWGHLEIAQKMDLAANSGTGEPHGDNWSQAVDSRKQENEGSSTTHSSVKGWESVSVALPPAMQRPLPCGWQCAARSSSFSSQSKVSEDVRNQNGKTTKVIIWGGCGGYDSASNTMPIQLDDDSNGDDVVEDMDDDLSDDYDSDVSQESHETRKKNKCFRVFFETLDSLSVDQINEPMRQWHCPACQRGPGSIAWYRGLQSLTMHGKTKGGKRIRVHRELAELLEEELQRRGIYVILAGEVFGKWKGLHETTADHDIVWPPMVVIMNTVLEQDENNKWVGMGSQELLEYFPSYAAVKARHSYGPHGHRGMSVLIFEASAMGYMEAEHLHKHFADEGKDREAWEHRRVLFYPGGKRQLYGYLALKEDIDCFNRHSQGRFPLKFEIRSYQEMVVGPMRQMSVDNRQLVWLKNNVAKLQQHSKTIEDTLEALSQKLHETMEENRILRLRTKMQHEEKEEMDQQEQFFKEQMDKVHKATEEQERIFEKLQKHAKARQPDVDTGNKEKTLREVENANVIDNQVKEVEKELAENDRLLLVHEECKTELRQMYLKDTLNAEKVINEDLTRSIEEYAPGAFEAGGST